VDESEVKITVKVQPRAKRTEPAGKTGDTYKLRLAAPPVDGKANEACIEFLAETFDVARSAVRILRGGTSRTKVIEIEGVDAAAVERKLGTC
jgi:uncharacterized protein (TIGR00251 family)